MQVTLCHGSLLYRLFCHLAIKPSTHYLLFLILSLLPPSALQQAPTSVVPLCVHVFSSFSSYLQEEHVIFGFLFLHQFANAGGGLQLHPCSCKVHYLIPFDGCIVFHGIYVTIFFIQSTIDGHLGGFYVLASVNSAAITYACVCLYNRRIYIHLGIYPVMGLLGQMVFLPLDLRGIATVFRSG